MEMCNKIKISNTNLAWLAGIIDGEGTIAVYCFKYKRPQLFYIPYISVANTKLLIIREVNRILKRMKVKTVYRELRKGYRKHHSALYSIYIRNLNDCIKVARTLEPFLVGKKVQAHCLIEFCKRRLLAKKKNTRWNPYTVRDINLYSMCKTLNKKGV